MKNKVKLILLPLRNSTFYVVICVIITCILIYGSYQILNMFPETVGVYKKLETTQLFIEGGNNDIDYSNLEPIFPFTYTDINLKCHDVSIGVEDNKFDPKQEISDTLKLQLQEDTISKQIVACPNYTSDIIEEYHLPNGAYGFEYMMGDYPEEGEVLIGEYVANLYASQNDFEDYKDLIGQEITISSQGDNYSFKISGITAGGFNILYNSEQKQNYQETSNFDYYVDFDSEDEKEKFIQDNNLNDKGTGITYYESSNYNYTSPQVFVILISMCLELLVIVSILVHPLKQIKLIIRFYKHQSNWYLIYFLPTCFMIGVVLFNIMFCEIFI